MKTVPPLAPGLLCLFALCATTVLGQSFQPGYIVDLNGTTINCLIDNREWTTSPSSIQIKANENSEALTVDVDSLTAFSVGRHRFIHADVRYDSSSQNLRQLTTTSSPQWTEGRLLLRVVVDGDIDLYHYRTNQLSLFFFKNRQQPIEQLIHKYYYARDLADTTQYTRRRLTNATYIDQLRKTLTCRPSANFNSGSTPYRLRALAAAFRDYHRCENAKFKDYTQEGSLVTLRVRPGVDLSSVKAEDGVGTTVLFPDLTSLRGGVELELDLPFPRRRWTFIAEPTFQSYRAQRPYRLDYQSLEIPVGIRRYFQTSASTSVFLNALMISDFPLVYEMDFSRTITLRMTSFRVNFGVGGGINFGKFSLEGRMHTPRRTRDVNTQSIDFEFRKTCVILGYKIF